MRRLHVDRKLAPKPYILHHIIILRVRRLHVDREICAREATVECKNERDGFEEECRGLREGLAALTDALKISKSVNRVKER